MTENFVVVLPPVSVCILYFFKHCVDKYTEYKELKLLVDAGVEQAEVENDHVSFQK